MRPAVRTTRSFSLLAALALTAGACGGGGSAAESDLEEKVNEAKELAYQAALSAEEAKSTADEALAAVAGDGTPGHSEGGGTDGAAAGEDSSAEQGTGTTEPAAAAHETPHWSYEGEEGPEHWASISAEFEACESGVNQSPIDLVSRTLEVGLDDLQLDWKPSELTIVDNGHTIQANIPAGNTSVIDGVVYDLVQFHFHKPSEHEVKGEAFPMELHFVHKNAAGGLAVIGVLLTVGEANPAYDVLWAAQPEAVTAGGEGNKVAGFDLTELLPPDRHAWRYPGSLTTPPCTEGVSWNVLATPAAVSQSQIDGFRYDHNARPVQEIGDRLVLADKS
ncbi:MAG: carbonic anhydrase family protein [Acidimicrobiales bacterium]